uniref:Uncharacterized protein n=1 Tax=Arundo donax TaxID=35708 RepID=A0A0A9CHW0_ARUDO
MPKYFRGRYPNLQFSLLARYFDLSFSSPNI